MGYMPVYWVMRPLGLDSGPQYNPWLARRRRWCPPEGRHPSTLLEPSMLRRPAKKPPAEAFHATLKAVLTPLSADICLVGLHVLSGGAFSVFLFPLLLSSPSHSHDLSIPNENQTRYRMKSLSAEWG